MCLSCMQMCISLMRYLWISWHLYVYNYHACIMCILHVFFSLFLLRGGVKPYLLPKPTPPKRIESKSNLWPLYLRGKIWYHPSKGLVVYCMIFNIINMNWMTLAILCIYHGCIKCILHAIVIFYLCWMCEKHVWYTYPN